MSQTNQIFTFEVQSSQYPFQLDKLSRQVNDFVLANRDAETHHFDLCPKCGENIPA